MCDADATSKEHVPPRCIFPRSSEYRKELLCVPSCDEHNGKKSKDDEYLRHILSSAPATNDLALLVSKEGNIPAWDRRPHLLNSFLPDLSLVDTGQFETASFTIDLKRFEASLSSMVRALYFSKFKEKLTKDINVIWGALLVTDMSEAPYLDLTKEWEAKIKDPYEGSNKEVFKYSFTSSVSGGLCRLCFYEGIPIYTTWFNPNQHNENQ